MIAAVLSGFLLSLIAPQIHQIGRRAAGWMLALLPMGLVIYFLSLIDQVGSGASLTASFSWVPSAGINLSFYVDGLSLVFALLISGIGALVIIYAGGYLAGHSLLGRFYAYILIFMASMLGLVLADNVITLFVFWELTSISSYLLIGFDHERAAARAAATQALLVTGGGGLALLAGLVLLGQVGGSLELSALISQGDVIRSHGLYLPILILILVGTFTKSAQFPFHFWLPGAMEGPAPVSTYLHSATMVKAGIYLLARLSPAMGGTEMWRYSIAGVGTITMLLGAYLAWQQTDLKRILAYSTVSALGTLVLLIGLDTPIAIKAAVVFLLVHAFYKGALFMTAGALDHETGSRDVSQLGGLIRVMPITFMSTVLAALSMAGLPLFLGFLSKELIYEATLESSTASIAWTSAAVLANMLMVFAAGIVAIQPFVGQRRLTPKHPHEAALSMWIGPLVLAGLGLLAGLYSNVLIKPVVESAAAAILGKPIELELSLSNAFSHGFNPMLILSTITVAGGMVFYVRLGMLRRIARPVNVVDAWGPERWYDWLLSGLDVVSQVQTRLLQSGYLRYYLITIIITTIGLIGSSLVSQTHVNALPTFPDMRSYELVIAILMLAGALVAVLARSRLMAVAALGVVGYGVSLTYILFSAPDLAMTQFAIETLTVILLVLVLYRLPKFSRFTGPRKRLRDAVIALAAGVTMTILVLIANSVPSPSLLTPYFAENSLTLAKGHNVVNVILVDFRGLDTLGEITVLALAGIGVFALMKLRLAKEYPTESIDATTSVELPEATDAYPVFSEQDSH